MTIKLTREEAIQDLKAIKSFERYAGGLNRFQDDDKVIPVKAKVVIE